MKTLLNQMQPLDLDRLVAARKAVKRAVAEKLRGELLHLYDVTSSPEAAPYQFNPKVRYCR